MGPRHHTESPDRAPKLYDPGDMDLEELRAFLVVAETGSFMAASLVTTMSRSTLRRRVAAFEKRARVPLFERSSRGIALTPAGRALMTRGRQMMEESEGLLHAVRDVGRTPSGMLKVCFPLGFPTTMLSASLSALRRQLPQVRFELSFEDQPQLKLRGGADIAIHFGEATIGDFDSVPLRKTRSAIFASRRYLARHGEPEDLEQLKQHQLLGPVNSGMLPYAWPLLDGTWVAVEPLLLTADPRVLKASAQVGIGIALLPNVEGSDFDAADDPAEQRELLLVMGGVVGRQQQLSLSASKHAMTLPLIKTVVACLVRRGTLG